MCDKDGEYVGHLLARCGQLCKQRMDQNLQNYDVTQAQAHVILYLIEAERQGEVYQKNLEKRFRIKAPTVNGIVERLEEKGFLTRAPGQRDGRCRRLHVTEKGRQLEREIHQRIAETEALMVQDFTEEERQMLHALLRRLRANLKEGEREV